MTRPSQLCCDHYVHALCWWCVPADHLSYLHFCLHTLHPLLMCTCRYDDAIVSTKSKVKGMEGEDMREAIQDKVLHLRKFTLSAPNNAPSE